MKTVMIIRYVTGFFSRIGLVCLLGMPVLTLADVVEGLYETEVPVEGQSQDEREEAAQRGLAQVLVSVSGQEPAQLLATDQNTVPRATRYVQQFLYRSYRPGEAIPERGRSQKPYTQKLWIRFDEKAVNQLLRSQNLPVWGKTRPATLVWLVVDDQRQRTMIGNNNEQQVRPLLEAIASQKGLPLRLPLLDLTDQARVKVTDVWGNFEDAILSASQRYQSEAVLVGRVYLTYGKNWHARWTLYLGGQRHDWEMEAESIPAVVAPVMASTAQVLSTRYAHSDTQQENKQLLVQVDGVKNLSSYQKVVTYLAGLSVIGDVQAYQVKADSVIFRLNAHTSKLGVAQSIALGHVLVADNRVMPAVVTADNQQNPVNPVDLAFKLIP